jgi:hypothetical protein
MRAVHFRRERKIVAARRSSLRSGFVSTNPETRLRVTYVC